jgi:hypothetical protein
MKLRHSIIAFGILFNVSILFGQVIDHPRSSITFEIGQESGTNGSSVVYNPDAQLYYTIIAGNTSYPLEVFDTKGNSVYETKTGRDMRGLWWNSKAGTLEGNCYDDGGIISYPLDGQSFPSKGEQTLFKGADHQPDVHSCGVYDSKKKQILYFYEGNIYAFKRSNGEFSKSISLSISNLENMNATTLMYTGVKKMEVGLLDYMNGKVYLYNIKTGEKTATITLPDHVITFSLFRVSYANNHVFIYDADKRVWSGFQIFN